MIELINALGDPEVPFIRYAFIAGLLSSIAFGIIGTQVVVRRISSMAGAVAHSVLAGIGLSLFLQNRTGIGWFSPIIGAVIAGVLSALVIGWVSMQSGQREDTIIGAIWAVGMAIGLLFISVTPGYTDPMSYLFGNILLISRTDLYLIGVLDVVVVIVGILLFNQLQATAYDPEFAAVRGLKNGFYFMLLLILVAVTVVLMVTIVGIVMVIALLTIPAAVSSLFVRNLRQMMVFSALFTAVFTTAGIGVSYSTDLPSGSMIIVVAGAIYFTAILIRLFVRRVFLARIRANPGADGR